MTITTDHYGTMVRNELGFTSLFRRAVFRESRQGPRKGLGGAIHDDRLRRALDRFYDY
ncbi:MAG: hypothetical protein AAGF04_01510 [Chlamydiota bacterium]